jgi:hypothetical protein
MTFRKPSVLRAARQTPGTRIDRAIDDAVITGVAVLILAGFATSYHTLLDLAITAGGYPPWLAPAVPLSFDLGIVVLSLKVAQAAREGRHAPILRLLVATLSAATVAANASAALSVPGRVLHAVPPAMFVICFESVIITARRHALQARGTWPDPLPRQHPLRWVLAPRATWTRWRATVLATTSPTSAPPGPVAQPKAQEVGGTGELEVSVRRPRPSETSRDTLRDLVAEALQEDNDISGPALRSALAACGVHLSLRSVQRLRAAARR